MPKTSVTPLATNSDAQVPTPQPMSTTLCAGNNESTKGTTTEAERADPAAWSAKKALV